MTLRAVLIGAQTYGLTGVHADVELMHAVLRNHGFTDVRTCTEELASYAGIKTALSRLGEATRRGDGVVVYYSGHGALLGELQYLVPVDMADSNPTDFRGYLAEELTAAVRVLTDVTPNVTVILDCCHSGGAVREAAYESGRWALKSVELPRVARAAGLERAAALSRPGDPLVPNVVRLTACQQHDSAYEAELRPGAGRQGVFTAALAKVLDPRRHPPCPGRCWSRTPGTASSNSRCGNGPTPEDPRDGCRSPWRSPPSPNGSRWCGGTAGSSFPAAPSSVSASRTPSAWCSPAVSRRAAAGRPPWRRPWR